MDIKEKFLQTIDKHKLIEKNDGIVVGVSGGPDSICLLHLLWSIKNDYDLSLYVVHLDHQFRGEESRQDAEYVMKFCERLGIESYIFSINVEDYSKSKGITFEEAGRELRYKLFNEIREKTKANKIAVAQNSNDQAETVLMRLIRGSGLEGLSAINYKRADGVIRPILDINRKEIEDYCEVNDLNPRIDKTNLEAIYTRNKVRLELLPYIEKNFNSNIIETLCRSSNILREENEYLEENSREILDEITIKSSNDLISIDLNEFNRLHKSVKRRIIRQTIEKIKGDLKDIFSNHIEYAIDLIKAGQVGAKINLPEKLLIELGYNSIDIKKSKGNTKNIEDFQYDLPLQGRVYIKELDVTINSIILSRGELEHSRDNNSILIDANKIKGSLVVRNRREGDRFTPLGMKGRKKIKDYFIDIKIPREKRNSIPLICDKEEIIWVAGYRMSEAYKVDNNTSKVVKLWLSSCVNN